MAAASSSPTGAAKSSQSGKGSTQPTGLVATPRGRLKQGTPLFVEFKPPAANHHAADFHDSSARVATQEIAQPAGTSGPFAGEWTYLTSMKRAGAQFIDYMPPKRAGASQPKPRGSPLKYGGEKSPRPSPRQAMGSGEKKPRGQPLYKQRIEPSQQDPAGLNSETIATRVSA